MPRIRTVKPEFFRSPDTAKASHKGRLLYAALWCWADDYGVGETNLYGLLGFAFPDGDGVSAEEIQRLCKEVADAYGVRFYTNRGREFYHVLTFENHQKTERKAKGKFPTWDHEDSQPDLRFHPSGDYEGISSDAGGSSALGTGEQGNRGTGEQLVAPARAHTIPEDWKPSNELRDYAHQKYPYLDVDDEHEAFMNHYLSISGPNSRRKDWDRTFRNWLKNARPRYGQSRTGSTVDDKFNGWLNMDIGGGQKELT